MGKYKVRKLYQTKSDAGPDHTAYESMWAYTVEHVSSTQPIPGRFRIRVTKLPAADYVAMMGGDPSDFEGGESVQGFLEKWSDKGWLHCLDWLGDISSSVENIENDLLKMFEAFTTGTPTNKNWTSNLPATPYKPPTPKKNKKPKLEIIEGDKPDSDDDLEWI